LSSALPNNEVLVPSEQNSVPSYKTLPLALK
jgi:hypothetical protein